MNDRNFSFVPVEVNRKTILSTTPYRQCVRYLLLDKNHFRKNYESESVTMP